MKVLVTGSTGRVGSGVLERCLAHPQITSVVALTRRPLEVKNHKLNNIVKRDYHSYDETEIQQLKGVEACIWALGSPSGGREVHIDYTNAALAMCQTRLVPQLPAGKKFRFVYTSGGAIPYLDSPWLFFLGPARKLRGDMDRKVVRLAEDNAATWESFIARPWYVVHQPPAISNVLGENSYILIPQLGAAMVDAVLNGSEKVYMDNAFMKQKGQQALKVQPN